MIKTLTLRYLLAITLLAVPVQGLMAADCELPSSNTQQETVSIEIYDHALGHGEQESDTNQLEQHPCCDEPTCPEMDSYCGSCMSVVSLTNENPVFITVIGSESHFASATVFVDLAPPPPTKPPV